MTAGDGVLSQALVWLNDPLTWTEQGGILELTGEHLLMTAAAVGAAAAVAIPVGAWLGHTDRGAGLVVWLTNASRALPTLGIVFLLASAGLFGNTATVIAAAFFAAPVLLVNTYEGVRGADPDARDAARGMGMSDGRILLQVELPLAVTLVSAGLRTTIVQVVATIPLAALAGGGGLGKIITFGLGTQRYGEVLAGGVIVALLCLAIDGALAVGQRIATPAPLRVRSG
ncbi:ABC transporter permease [Promicromonospora thailandica]|uniref:Osmoprotectant transport system permease protein n=1 Tax=Promicromonospora thailandica TaxID=765201 RepID=A0A9X2FX06_9MICO|nr:ABC transporter permease subunit [Promicromonospora thailandica]MCP2262885.1 osmoprotectant transport system permease protein [Promicromonospora thailandica]BFF18230.1 ABC transporter permease [Promicromonospora thailandica]